MKKINNRGFTLVEVLAVIVILVIIVSIAIPNISASLERQDCKITKNRAKLIESSAKFYVSDNRNMVNSKLNSDQKCKIEISKLKGKYLTEDDLKDKKNEDNVFADEEYVIYNASDESYNFCFINDNCTYNSDVCKDEVDKCYD